MRCQWDRLKVKHISVCLFPQSLLGNLYENHFNTLNRKSIILPLSNFSLCQHNQSYKLWCLQGWTSQLNQSVHSVCLFLSLSLLSNLAHLFCSSRQMSRSRLIRSLLHFVIVISRLGCTVTRYSSKVSQGQITVIPHAPNAIAFISLLNTSCGFFPSAYRFSNVFTLINDVINEHEKTNLRPITHFPISCSAVDAPDKYNDSFW